MIAWMRRHWRDCPDRSRVAVPGKASQRAGASGFGGDPGASWVSAGTHGTGQHGTRAGQELRRTLARLQRAQPRSGESRRAESGTATGTGTVAVGDRRAEPADLPVQRTRRSPGAAWTKADYPWNQAF